MVIEPVTKAAIGIAAREIAAAEGPAMSIWKTLFNELPLRSSSRTYDWPGYAPLAVLACRSRMQADLDREPHFARLP